MSCCPDYLSMSSVLPLHFSGSVIRGSLEECQLEEWIAAGMRNRAIWSECEASAHITGKPSSYIIQAVRTGEHRVCACCGTEFYASRASSDSEGLYCTAACYRAKRAATPITGHRGLGQRKRKQHAAAEPAGPLTDYHLITDSGARVTVAVRGSIDVWLRAQNRMRRYADLEPYRQAEP